MTEPARVAASPELIEVEQPVHAVGIGPGDPAYATGHAREVIGDAEVIVGFESVLDRIDVETTADVLRCTYDDQERLLREFADRVGDGELGAALLMGDPNVSGYTFLGRVERAVDRPVRVVPGVSSIQIAASRVRTPLERSTVVTLHKRGDLSDDLDRLGRDAGDRNLIVLPRPYDWMPDDIAANLVDEGAAGDLDAFVCERLTLDDECIGRYSLAELAAAEDPSFSDLSVLVVKTE